MLQKAENFAADAVLALMREKLPVSEGFLISPCPVSSALALMALLTRPAAYPSQAEQALRYLDAARNPDGGWGRTPASPSDKRSTEICQTAVDCAKKGLNAKAIAVAAQNIGTTWLQDVPELLLGWNQDSPLARIIEYFILSDTTANILADISFDHLPIALALLPPGGRPLIIALSCIRQKTSSSSTDLGPALHKLLSYQTPNGSWCEDILITSLSVLCLALNRRYPAALAAGLKWLAGVQYPSGAWPSFNQLTNWDVGLTAFMASMKPAKNPALINKCVRFLAAKANNDGSYGTLSPFAFPDLDDTAVALIGLAASAPQAAAAAVAAPAAPATAAKTALPARDHHARQIAASRQLLMNLQNKDGSWSTFPEVSGSPPQCDSRHPVHIKSVDVGVHVMQALLRSGSDINSPPLQKGLWWLLHRQQKDGAWPSTWYRGKAYATAQALELLADYDIRTEARSRAAHWLLTMQRDNGSWSTGSVGECGLAVTALLKNGSDPGLIPDSKRA